MVEKTATIPKENRHGDPRQPTPFLGREQELAQVVERLTDPGCRLLSLLGPGGIGKTRLAVQAAFQLEKGSAFRDGTFLIPLQALTDSEYLASAIAAGLDIGLSGADNPATQIVNRLRKKRILLVLDSFEHLADENGLQVVVQILEAAPDVKILVTSRQALQLRQEWRYPMQGLSVPGIRELTDPEEFESVELFISCAERIQPDFSPADELEEIVRICRLVGGMPLAIELAAAARQRLSSSAIAEGIESGLGILHTEMRDVPDRHRSMRAVFDHSWRLLTSEEKRGFCRLSVFRGSFSRKAAGEIAETALPTLSTLVDKSLLHRSADGRYHLHELLRQYGEQKLSASPRDAARLRKRHGEYFTGFLHQRLEAVHGPDQHQSFAEIDSELQNVRVAWQWAVSEADVHAIHRAATTFFLFCQQKCFFLEGANALAKAAVRLERLTPTPHRDRTLARLYNHEGWLRIRVGEFEKANSLLEHSRAMYNLLESPPPPHMGADPAVGLAVVAVIQGDSQRALRLAESSRQSSEQRGDRHNLAFAHYALTAAHLSCGKYETAQEHARKACDLARSLGNRWFLAYPLNEWGKAARELGDYAQAKRHFQSSFAIRRDFNDPEGMGVALNHLAEIALRQGDLMDAREAFQRSLRIYRDLNDHGGLASSERGLGAVSLAMGEANTARDHFRRALQTAAEIQYLPLIFSLLVDIEMLVRQQGNPILGAQLLSLVRTHPASDQRLKVKASRQLESLEQLLSRKDFEEAVRYGEAWDLDSAVAALHGPLSRPPGDDEPASGIEDRLIEPLTGRELEILSLIAQGHTNPKIAEELVLAVGTVKWYASQIYGKLGVSNRTEAASRARELGLL